MKDNLEKVRQLNDRLDPIVDSSRWTPVYILGAFVLGVIVGMVI